VSQIVLDSEQRRQHAIKVLSLLPIEPPKVVQIEDYREQRTAAQNRRLWKLHTLASEVTGYDPEEMHDHALCKHFGFTEKEVTNPFTGEIETKRKPNKRSSRRNTLEFTKFMEQTEIWYITEFGVFLGQD